MAEVSPSTAAWGRYASTFLAYFVVVLFMRTPLSEAFARPNRTRDGVLLLALGFMAFCFSPLTHMLGLSGTQATDSSLIIAMEPLITILLARVFLRERLSRFQILVFATAFLGFLLLSGLTPQGLGAGWSPHFGANLLLLFSLCGEAAYSVIGKPLLERYAPARVFGTASLVGAACLTLAVLSVRGPGFLSEILGMSAPAWLGLFWLGPLGTTATYLYWMFALRHAPVATLALTIFIQPLCGAIWGYLILGDRLTPVQTAGGLLLLGAVFAETARHMTRRANAAPALL